MSSGIKLIRICEYCNNEFTAKTTVTKYCGRICTNKAYKTRQELKKRNTLITEQQKLHTKEFLTVKEVANLLSCSIRTVYYQIEQGKIKAVNLGERMTRVRRSDIDKIFEQQQIKETNSLEIVDCYSLLEILDKYNISDRGLRNLVRRHNIPKLQKGWYVYLPKIEIHKYLGE